MAFRPQNLAVETHVLIGPARLSGWESWKVAANNYKARSKQDVTLALSFPYYFGGLHGSRASEEKGSPAGNGQPTLTQHSSIS
jgi:hypothetical protein